MPTPSPAALTSPPALAQAGAQSRYNLQTDQHGGQSDDEILTEKEAAAILRISVRTLQRLSEDGRGPSRIQLTERRVGYWRRGCLSWAATRTQPVKHAA